MKFNQVLCLYLFAAKFINFHPSMRTTGEISYFERGNYFFKFLVIPKSWKLILDDYYQKGIEYYRRKMPRASDDQVVLAKEARA